MKYDLINVSKLRDNGRNKVTFYTKEVFVKNLKTNEVIIKGNRHNEMYKVDDTFDPSSKVCLSSLKDDTRIWHRRLGHTSTCLVNKLYSRDLVEGLPKVKAYLDGICEECVKEKQFRVSINSKKVISTMKETLNCW